MTGEAVGGGLTILLLARSAIAAAPLKEMERFRAIAEARSGVGRALFAFSEQGSPSLRDVIETIVATGCERLVVVPLQLPFEQSFLAWLKRTLVRWRDSDNRPWPVIHVAPILGDDSTVGAMLGAALDAEALPIDLDDAKTATGGSIVPAQKLRVLVCMGGPCNVAGAEVIWGHLRNEQDRLSLRTTGEGSMSAKASCLGPCSLAPVVQVWPEGTYYGGVDEAAMDRIIAEHLIGGRVVDDFAYEPMGKKQTLRNWR